MTASSAQPKKPDPFSQPNLSLGENRKSDSETGRKRFPATELLWLTMPLGALGWAAYDFGLSTALVGFSIYLAIVSVQYVLILRYARQSGKLRYLAFWFPIAAMVFVKHPRPLFQTLGLTPEWVGGIHSVVLVGFSYMAFRLCHLALEVRNEVVPLPSFPKFLGFSFFLPTWIEGPISRYSRFEKSNLQTIAMPGVRFRAIQRILIGAAKWLVIGNWFNGLTGLGLLTAGNRDLPVYAWTSVIAFYLRLYFDFSGACDMAVGFAALLGIEVEENFDRPFLARNVKDFWNRWHITLSVFMRDTVFTPLSKLLVTRGGKTLATHAVALSITPVFLLIGAWHGLSGHFILFGSLHALGVSVNHYYGLWLRRTLSKERYLAYQKSKTVERISIGLTFAYVALTLIFFQNGISDGYSLCRHLF